MKLSDIDLMKVGDTIQIAGCVWAGEGKMFLCLFPEEQGDLVVGNDSVVFSPDGPEDDMDVVVLDMDRKDWESFIRQSDLMETEVLAKAADGTLAKTVIRKSNRQIDQSVSWTVFKRDGYSCRYCGRDDVPLTVDHLVRWEEGGPSIPANLLSACRKCNKTRGPMPYHVWLQSKEYRTVSGKLDQTVREDNLLVAETLHSIPVKAHVNSR